VKKEYIILAAAIVALGLYLVLRSNDRTHYVIPEITAPDREQITSIDISGPSGTLTLKRFDDVWKSEPEGYPIDRGKIDAMLEALSGINVVSLVSEAGSYVQYDLDPDKRVFVEATGGTEPLLKIEIGKPASTNRHTYVKLEGDSRVYQVSGNIRRTFDVAIPGIRDKKVMTIDRAAITGLSVETGGETLSLAKVTRPVEPVEEGQAPTQNVTAWITADSTEADGTVVDGILGRIVNLQCDGFPEEGLQVDLGKPTYTLIIQEARPDTLRIYGPAGEKTYLATSSQYEFPFMISEWKLGQIKKTPSEVMGQKKETK
jgi:hypothetical protein